MIISNKKKALARAVYSRRTLLILDDSFSGLDATSEDRIFSRLLGEQGLLRKLGVTVVLVTHAAHRLSYADHIVSLEKGGSISEQGTFDELMKSGGYVSLLTARHKSENGGGASEESTESTDPKAINPEISAESLDPPVGDLAVYNYYFDACGWTNMGIFFVLMASFAFFILFPGVCCFSCRLKSKKLILLRFVDKVLDTGSSCTG
jgi:ATP-binding cassette subfamily C (CFTR/MRP) protein 1